MESAYSQTCDLQNYFIDSKDVLAKASAAQRDKMTIIDLQVFDSIVDRPKNYPSWSTDFRLSKNSVLKAILCTTAANSSSNLLLFSQFNSVREDSYKNNTFPTKRLKNIFYIQTW